MEMRTIPAPDARRWTDALRVPVRGDHVAWLDGWRGVCILLVLAGHFVAPLGFAGSVGVEFFFALSGRLMAEILIERRQPVATFVRRRIARVVPATCVYISVCTPLLAAAALRSGQPFAWASPAAAMLFVHNYLPAASVTPVLEHTWSLAVEEHSYLLLIAIVLLAGRRPGRAALLALGIAALAIANGMWLSAHPAEGAQWVSWRSDVRAASVLLSFAFQIGVRMPGGQARAALLGGALALGALSGIAPVWPGAILPSTVVAILGANLIDFAPAAAKRALAHPLLTWAGTLSFSLYLWQQLFYVLLKGGAPEPVLLPLLVVCATLSYKTVEQPWRERLSGRTASRARPARPRA